MHMRADAPDITLPTWFMPAALICGVMFAASPVIIALSPYEAEMGLVQKIFYYHLPSAWMFLLAGIVCGVASVRYLASSEPRHDRVAWAAAELLVLFGAITLVTGPLWARKTWGLLVDLGREADVESRQLAGRRRLSDRAQVWRARIRQARRRRWHCSEW